MNLMLLDAAEVDAGGVAVVSDHRASHLARVLRVARGQTVRIGMIDGPHGVGTVASCDAGRVELRCAFDGDTPERPRVDLLLALPRPKVMNRLWAQLAALGVGRVVVTNAEKVERPYFDTHVLDPAHYRPLLLEGLQQARDTRVPLVSVHRQFRVLVEDELDSMAADAVRLVADPSATQSLFAALPPPTRRRVMLAVGPEGGWSSFELKLLRAHGFDAVSMGARTLRSDTASIALVSLTHAALDDATVAR